MYVLTPSNLAKREKPQIPQDALLIIAFLQTHDVCCTITYLLLYYRMTNGESEMIYLFTHYFNRTFQQVIFPLIGLPPTNQLELQGILFRDMKECFPLISFMPSLLFI